ncbi:MAG TPA: NAD-dependent epimerase/dehydratase family protein [Terriglobales bacterium]|nr:NAD-dependent epimerase/dehydratase family protein [Terriglobales bacterium]
MAISLVTGGAGFMGSHLAEHLLQRGGQVVILDDLSGGFTENVPPEATFIQGSILDHALLERLFERYSFDYVYHFAAYAAEALSHFIRRFNYSNNLTGTANLINESVNHGVKCFVFASSIAVYGELPSPLTEEMTAMPEDPYGIAKLAAEQDLRLAHKMFGLPYVIFRPHNVYGERQNIADAYRNAVGIFMNQVLKGEPMTIFGDGEQQRAFTCVRDVIPILADCVHVKDAQNQVFNIGSDTPSTVNELAHRVASALGRACKIKYLPPRSEAKISFCGHEKIRRVFRTAPETSLERGIHAMAKWVRAHGPRQSRSFEAIEISKNLPAGWRRAA